MKSRSLLCATLAAPPLVAPAQDFPKVEIRVEKLSPTTSGFLGPDRFVELLWKNLRGER